jgi:hypothetical protein
MSFEVSPLAGSLSAASSVSRAYRATERSQASFTDAVSTTAPPIPAEVWDQVDDAGRLAENLTAEGREVRFDVHKLNGGVVASLVADDGSMLRPLLLGDVVDVRRLTHELGKEQ